MLEYVTAQPSPLPLLADIVLFGLSLKVFETRMLGRGFHIFIKGVLFFSPTDVGSHNPSLSGSSVLADICSLLQSMWDPPILPLRGSASSLAHLVSDSDTICNSLSPLLADIVLFGLFLSSFFLRFLKCVC